MELGVLLYFMVLKSSTWLLHAINVKSICRQSTYPNHSCFTLYICSRARDFNSHLFFKIWKNTSGHVCSTEASNDGTSDNETNRLVVQVVKWGLLWKKRNTMKEGNPNPKQECSDIAKSFLSFIFQTDLLTYLTGNIWQPNGLTKILLKLSIGSAAHFWPFSQLYWLQTIPRKLG